MKFTTVAVISAAFVSSIPTPGIGESAWKAISAIPKRVSACIGSCINGVEEAVTVQIPAAVHGLGDGLSSGAKVGKHEAQQSAEVYANAVHREKESIAAAKEAEQKAEQLITDARLAQRREEYAASELADKVAFAAFQKATDERRAAMKVVQAAKERNDQAAYEAALAAFYAKENAEEQARAVFRTSRDAFKKDEDARLAGFFKGTSS